MSDALRRYRLLAKTAAGKTPRQLVGTLHRKARNRIVPGLPVDVDSWYQRHVPTDLDPDTTPHAADTQRLRIALSDEERARYRTLASDFADGWVTFLNRSREIPDPAAVAPDDERIREFPRLWYLKLAGFEPVRWGVLGYCEPGDSGEFARAVEAWLATTARQEAIASRPGYLRGFWTPYAVSLRIVTLCRYAGWLGGFPDRSAEFLYKNLLFLNRNVERDVDGNHLFENGTALVVGGVAFPAHGDRFVKAGLDVLESAAERQFLDDGYHYERSPMYHLAVTTRLLTALSVLREGDRGAPHWLEDISARSRAFLSYLRPPDGRIPLLNDSVLAEAEQLSTVAQYADALGVESAVELDGSAVTGESDLHWLSADPITMLVDAGDSGPPNQLAHTHNDPGTVLVWSSDTRLIVDTGTFDYQPGESRRTARSVRAHNTVQVGETEPVSYGGRFQMSGAVKTTTDRAESDAVDALVVAYSAGDDARYTHRRTIYAGPDWLLVRDNVDHAGTEAPSHTSRLQAHPAVTIEGDSPYQFVHETGPALSVRPIYAEKTAVATGRYFPRFGEENAREVLLLDSESRQSGYLLTADTVSATFNPADGPSGEVSVDGERYRLPSVGGES